MSQDATHYLQTARQAALRAGDLIRQRLGSAIRVDKKGRIDLVTEVDTACEALIRSTLTSEFPDHRILGEEGGEIGGEGPCRWLVDPLDGTTNFAQGYPFFAVSIGLEIEGRMEVGVVHDPTRHETFWAIRGQGAWLDDRPIHVTNCTRIDDALLVTGFPYDVRSCPDIHLDLFRDFVLKARGIRRDGAAALDLCYVACGRFDGFWELGLSPWDLAAGSLIVTEAGGRVTDFAGRPLDLECRHMVSSNLSLHRGMLDTIQPHLPALQATPYWKG